MDTEKMIKALADMDKKEYDEILNVVGGVRRNKENARMKELKDSLYELLLEITHVFPTARWEFSCSCGDSIDLFEECGLIDIIDALTF